MNHTGENRLPVSEGSVDQTLALQELRRVFRSRVAWQQWSHEHNFVREKPIIDAALSAIRSQGVIDPFTGCQYSPVDVDITGDNLRETIRAGRLISRHRALLAELKQAGRKTPRLLTRKAKIYAPEALTEFALYMRGHCPKYLGSEFAENESTISDLFPIPHQDLQSLTFPDSVFDLVLSNDVFEHVPDLDRSLRECARVLNPQGILIGTFPFAYNQQHAVKKCVIEGTQVKYLMEPEYHGNPMNPEKGSLVFEIPGWDMIERGKAAGFTDACFVFHASIKLGILGYELAGVFVYCACKSGAVDW
jgi:SAM-dependent methyltransferase